MTSVSGLVAPSARPVGDPGAVTRPGRAVVDGRAAGELTRVGPIGVHHPDVATGVVRDEAVGRDPKGAERVRSAATRRPRRSRRSSAERITNRMTRKATRAIGDPTATRDEMRMGGSLMVASQRGSGRIRRAWMRMSSTERAGGTPPPTCANWSATKRSKVDVVVHEDRSVTRAPSVGGPARMDARIASRPRWRRDAAVP